MVVPLKPNEVVVKADSSTYHISDQTVQGKLIVTNQRVYFKTTGTDRADHNLELPPDEIREVIYYSNGLFRPKGLNVIFKDGKEHRFTLKKRDQIGSLINKMY